MIAANSKINTAAPITHAQGDVYHSRVVEVVSLVTMLPPSSCAHVIKLVNISTTSNSHLFAMLISFVFITSRFLINNFINKG